MNENARPVRHGFREKRVTTAIGGVRVRVFHDSVMLAATQGRSDVLLALSPREAERLALALSEASNRIAASPEER